MSQNVLKRSLTTKKTDAPSKKRKLSSGKVGTLVNRGTKGTRKHETAFERATIPIPDYPDDNEQNVSDQDAQFFEENPMASNFLENLDYNGIARSKMEIKRLHKLSKPPRLAPRTDDLPSLDSHDEDGTETSDVLDSSDIDSNQGDDERAGTIGHSHSHELDSDVEQRYERASRGRRGLWDETDTIAKLPIKLLDGKVVRTGGRAVPQSDDESDEPEGSNLSAPSQQMVEDVATSARFGRPAVASVIGNSSRAARIQMAKEQIASISQDILADPEGSLGLLRRLHSFSLAKIGIVESSTPVPNDPLIRRLAMVSQAIVFKDIIPGYRIRPLSNAEKAEKVSQMVAKTREFEQGLVSTYQAYLKSLESELKAKTEFSDVALKAMCTLLKEATHFNFRTNLMSAIVARLSKKSWDSFSELCLKTIISVFREDDTGTPSLEIVRLINRMVKERNFNVHPNTLSCLLHLRLKSELGGIRASQTQAGKETPTVKKWESKGKANHKRAKGKKVDGAHMSKKAIKVLKERKVVEEQMREAEAQVDQEEKANMHTETLKLLFVLYFRILKAPPWTPLLPCALQGLTRYAHLVNIDFFRDLLQVLKDLIAYNSSPEAVEVPEQSGEPSTGQIIYYRLFCVTTAFELLSGQGEALNIDLRDFVDHLYTLIPPISLQSNIEAAPFEVQNTSSASGQAQTIAGLLFRALTLVFPVRASGTQSPVRIAAFAKRLVSACLAFPRATAIRSLEFVHGLLVKEPKLQALLSTEDRTVDGIYRPELDDPQLSNPFGTSFWELAHLAITHWDSNVREKALELSRFDGP